MAKLTNVSLVSKPRKSLNVSLQSKKYQKSINDVLDEWELRGETLSTKICEVLLTAYNMEKSPSIENILNTYNMIKKSLSRYIQDKNELDILTEQTFTKIFKLDGQALTQVIMNPESLVSENNIKYENSNRFYEEIDTQRNIATEITADIEEKDEEPIYVPDMIQVAYEKASYENKELDKNKKNDNFEDIQIDEESFFAE